MSMGNTAVRRLNDYVSALSYWRKKQNKTKLGGSFVKGLVCPLKIKGGSVLLKVQVKK